MPTNHTQTPSLPVVAVSNNDGTWHIAPSSAFKDGKRWYQDKTADDMTEANAAHIVRCVNERDELIAALEAGIKWFELPAGQEPDCDALAVMRAALAKAQS